MVMDWPAESVFQVVTNATGISALLLARAVLPPNSNTMSCLPAV